MDGRKVSTPICTIAVGALSQSTERARTTVSVHSGRIGRSRLSCYTHRVSDLYCASFCRTYGLEIIQNPERGRTCGFGDKVGSNPRCSGWISLSLTIDCLFCLSRTDDPLLQHSLRNSWQQMLMALQLLPSKPARILSNVNKLNNGMPYRKIDPSFFIVAVDLWSGNGKEERDRVLNNTPREKVQRDKRRQATHDSRPDSVIYPLFLSIVTKINASPGSQLSCQRTFIQ